MLKVPRQISWKRWSPPPSLFITKIQCECHSGVECRETRTLESNSDKHGTLSLLVSRIFWNPFGEENKHPICCDIRTTSERDGSDAECQPKCALFCRFGSIERSRSPAPWARDGTAVKAQERASSAGKSNQASPSDTEADLPFWVTLANAAAAGAAASWLTNPLDMAKLRLQVKKKSSFRVPFFFPCCCCCRCRLSWDTILPSTSKNAHVYCVGTTEDFFKTY